MDVTLRRRLTDVVNTEIHSTQSSLSQTVIVGHVMRNVRYTPPDWCAEKRINLNSIITIETDAVTTFQNVDSKTITRNLIAETEAYVRSRPGADAQTRVISDDTREKVRNTVENIQRAFIQQTVVALNSKENISAPVCVLDASQTTQVTLFASAIANEAYNVLSQSPECTFAFWGLHQAVVRPRVGRCVAQ